jgi:integrase
MKRFDPYVIPTSSGTFAVRFIDPEGKVRAISCSKKQAKAQEAADWIGRVLEKPGAELTVSAKRWLEEQDERLVGKLREHVLRGESKAVLTGCAESFAAFTDSFRAQKPERAEYVVKVLTAFAKRGKVTTVSQITLAVAERVFGEMVEGAKATNTVRKHQQVLKQFCGWAVRQGLMTVNPLAEMRGAVGGIDRRERKALTPEEQEYLLGYTARASDRVWHTRDGVERCRITGPERALLYRFAIGTGLRSNEIRSLTRASFALNLVANGRRSSVVNLKAASEKNRKGTTQPLYADLADALAKHLAHKLPGAPAFAMPMRDEVAGMVRADLAGARREWLEAATGKERVEREASDVLALRSHDGGVFDFHALRVTFITNMARRGVPFAHAVKLARHSDPKLTNAIYTKAGAMGLEDTIEMLADAAPVKVSKRSAI